MLHGVTPLGKFAPADIADKGLVAAVGSFVLLAVAILCKLLGTHGALEGFFA